jgi:hypothetical protein
VLSKFDLVKKEVIAVEIFVAVMRTRTMSESSQHSGKDLEMAVLVFKQPF